MVSTKWSQGGDDKGSLVVSKLACRLHSICDKSSKISDDSNSASVCWQAAFLPTTVSVVYERFSFKQM